MKLNKLMEMLSTKAERAEMHDFLETKSDKGYAKYLKTFSDVRFSYFLIIL